MLYRMNLTENLLTSEGSLHWSQHICDCLFPCQVLLGFITFAVMLKISFGCIGGRCVQTVFQNMISQVERILGDFCAAKMYVKEKY